MSIVKQLKSCLQKSSTDEVNNVKTTEVGWALIENSHSVIWEDPQPYRQPSNRSVVSKSVLACPAVVDFDARHYVVPCPVDLHLRFAYDSKQRPTLVNLAGDNASIRSNQLNQMMAIVNAAEWRHPQRPVIQVTTPYVFLADTPVYINQLPPYLHYFAPQRPGLLIGGRFPIHIWIRPLMWAFEWHDINQELQIKRGDPWFYLRFETNDPSRSLRLIESEITPDVERYISSMSGVANYVNRTFSLFATAQRRRPKILVHPKRRK